MMFEPSLGRASIRSKWLLFGVVLALLASSLVFWVGFDRQIVSWVFRSRIDPDANPWVEAFTMLGKGWLQIWLLLIWFAVSHRRREVLAGILALILVGVGVGTVKVAVGRVRPYSIVKSQEAGGPEHGRKNHLSFPSGDTAGAFGVAGAVAPAAGWPLRLAFLGVAAAVGGLRVTSLAHYPSDVLAGAAIGLLAGWLALRGIDKWGQAGRAVPFERWLVWAGIAGLPISLGFSEGADELLLFLRTYGVLALWVLFLVGLGSLWQKTGPQVVLAFLARTRHIVVSAALIAVIAENVAIGAKPRELFPWDGPASPWAAAGFVLVLAGVLLRVRFQNRIVSAWNVSDRLAGYHPYRLHVGSFLVVCGLLMQLQGWTNWLVVIPLFVLFYGAALVRREPSLSQVQDRQSQRVFAGPGRVWGGLVLICLPLMLELLVEDFVCETLLQM
jgi:undecaprenyl-diphosphatase